MARVVRIYFDFISPYSYLALMRLEEFGARHGVVWEPAPVFYAALLDATGLVGPAETRVKRRYTLADVLRAAALQGVPLVGPPAHPFRSLEALRVATLFADDPRALELAVALSTACWGEGRDLTDWHVLAEVVDRVVLASAIPAGGAASSAGADLAARASAPEVKVALQQRTAAAIDAGVFGVPTFELDGELFWGHDRLEHLAARLEGRLPDLAARTAVLEGRPRAADRPSAPILRESTAR